MKYQKTLLLLAMCAGSLTTTTANSALVSFSNVSVTAVNTAITNAPNSSFQTLSDSASSSFLSKSFGMHTAVNTPATTEKPGVLDVFTDETSITTTNSATWNFDRFSENINADSTLYSGAKWIYITGTATATENTNVNFLLSASGFYHPATLPFGQVIPSMPGFYFGSSLDNLSSVTSTSNMYSSSYTLNTNNGYDYSDQNLHLSAATSANFVALIYALNDASLSTFSLTATSGDYNNQFSQTINKSTVSTLTGTETIAAVPVPAAVWLFGSGLLGLTGFARKRKAA